MRKSSLSLAKAGLFFYNLGMNTSEETQEIIIKAGEKKANATAKYLLFKGFLAGLLIGFAALASTLAAMNLLKNPETFGVGKLVQGAVFSGGLIMVVLTGAELFTGNNLMLISLFDRHIGLKGLLKNWGLVFIGNLAGSLFLALLGAFAGVFKANSGLLGETLASIAVSKVNLEFLPAVVLGMFCNILVCLAVYMAFSAKTVSGKWLACVFPVMFFVMMGFEHSVANMFYIPAGFLAAGNFDIFGFFANLFPVTLGNILGGLVVSVIVYFSGSKKHDKISLCKMKNPKNQKKSLSKSTKK